MVVSVRRDQLVQRTQQLELVGQLASGVAHELNNLLTIALNLTSLVRQQLPDNHPACEDLSCVAEAGQRAAELARQLLSLGKQKESVTGRVEISEVVRRTLTLLRGSIPLKIEVDSVLVEEPIYAEADEGPLQQVLVNLCLNARDAMPYGGRILIQTEIVRDEDGGEQIRLSVQDTGQGMTEAIQARIFEPFFTTKDHGTGLGLPMVKRIVEGFDGRIDVSSRLSEGTRFDIWLPRC